ncbi:MAG: FAD-dependent oxidoreductase [Deltaproteobacteria bacterium]|nr:FAD-dependent oxidoreductase [Candidatus Zymogenaceae bacterium]
MTTKITLTQIDQYPEVPSSWGGMEWNKTGSWRFLMPVFSPRPSPCSRECPLQNNIPEMMALLADGDTAGATLALALENPFPAVLGRVCPAFCTEACNRDRFDERVSIRAVERLLGNEALKKHPDLPKRKATGKSVAIVGSGPAGLSTARFLALLGYAVTVFEREEAPGGVLRLGIPPYRLPRDILDSCIDAIRRLGVDIRTGVSIGTDIILTDLEKDFDAVFAAPGAHRSLDVDLGGYTGIGVLSGLSFLADVFRGTIDSVTGEYAVIGGGNTALDAARTILRLGGSPHIYYRRSRDEMPAFTDEIEEAREEDIPISYLTAPVGLTEKKGRLAMTLITMELGEEDASGRRRPVQISGSEREVCVDRVITAVGEAEDFSFMGTDGDKKDPVSILDAEGVLLGGDAGGGRRTVADAAAAGKRAAIMIDARLSGRPAPEATERMTFSRWLEERPAPEGDPVAFEDIQTAYFKKSDAYRLQKTDPHMRSGDFSEVTAGPTERDAAAEAARCFVCGTCIDCKTCERFCPDFSLSIIRNLKARGVGSSVRVDEDFCKGCGICARECPRGVIVMKTP